VRLLALLQLPCIRHCDTAHTTATLLGAPLRHNVVYSNGSAVLHYCIVISLHEAGCHSHFSLCPISSHLRTADAWPKVCSLPDWCFVGICSILSGLISTV